MDHHDRFYQMIFIRSQFFFHHRRIDATSPVPGNKFNIEPEPGCVLQYSRDMVNFFESFLVRGGDEAAPACGPEGAP